MKGLNHAHPFGALRFLFFTLLLGISSCGNDPTVTSNASEQYQLVAVDSFSIDRLSELSLEDYHDGTGELMMSDGQLAEILVVDQEGNIINSFNPIIQGPNTIGNVSYGWTFYGADQIVAYSRVHYHLLTKNGERLKRVLYPVETGGMFILDYNPKMITTVGEGKDLKVVTLITQPSGYRLRSQDSAKMIYTLDMETGEGRPIMHKPANGALRSLGEFVGHGWPHMARLKENLFVVGYDIDTRLYLYDASKDSLINSLELPEAYHSRFKSVAFSSRDKPYLQKSIVQVLGLGDHFMVQVLTNIPEDILNDIMRMKGDMRRDALESAMRTYIKSNYLLFDTRGFVQELEFDLGATDYRMLGTQDGALWVQRLHEEERDYRTFVKYQLQATL